MATMQAQLREGELPWLAGARALQATVGREEPQGEPPVRAMAAGFICTVMVPALGSQGEVGAGNGGTSTAATKVHPFPLSPMLFQ